MIAKGMRTMSAGKGRGRGGSGGNSFRDYGMRSGFTDFFGTPTTGKELVPYTGGLDETKAKELESYLNNTGLTGIGGNWQPPGANKETIPKYPFDVNAQPPSAASRPSKSPTGWQSPKSGSMTSLRSTADPDMINLIEDEDDSGRRRKKNRGRDRGRNKDRKDDETDTQAEEPGGIKGFFKGVGSWVGSYADKAKGYYEGAKQTGEKIHKGYKTARQVERQIKKFLKGEKDEKDEEGGGGGEDDTPWAQMTKVQKAKKIAKFTGIGGATGFGVAALTSKVGAAALAASAANNGGGGDGGQTTNVSYSSGGTYIYGGEVPYVPMPSGDTTQKPTTKPPMASSQTAHQQGLTMGPESRPAPAVKKSGSGKKMSGGQKTVKTKMGGGKVPQRFKNTSTLPIYTAGRKRGGNSNIIQQLGLMSPPLKRIRYN